MHRYLLSISGLLLLNACACALDDDDRAAGKPPIWQCFAANSLKAVACKKNATDPGNCTTTPH